MGNLLSRLRMRKQWSSTFLRLTFLVLCILQFAICNSASAAPHITRGKPEPPSKVGKHLKERMKAKAMNAPPMMMANATAGTVEVLFLRVEFQNETSVTDWTICYSTPPTVQNG